MAAVDATIVFLPRFTTLVGAGTFQTAPLDVSRFEGVQFEAWRGPIRGGSGTVTLYLEESLDAATWVLGPSTPAGYVLASEESKFFSYAFRLRWFRLRVVVTNANSIVTCWAEGLLRGGGGGLWSLPAQAGGGSPTVSAAGVVGPPAPGPGGGPPVGSGLLGAPYRPPTPFGPLPGPPPGSGPPPGGGG